MAQAAQLVNSRIVLLGRVEHMDITTRDHQARSGKTTTRHTRCNQTGMKRRCDISAGNGGAVAMTSSIILYREQA